MNPPSGEVAPHLTRAGTPGCTPTPNPPTRVQGGYDPRLPENVDHLRELRLEADALGAAPFLIILPFSPLCACVVRSCLC